MAVTAGAWSLGAAPASAGPATVPCGPAGGDKVPGCSVTVSETANLTHGQVVTVSWIGMDPAKDIYLVQCGVPPANSQQGGGRGSIPCNTPETGGAKVPAGSANGSTKFTVRTGQMGSAQCPPPPGEKFTVGPHAGKPAFCQISLYQGAGGYDKHNTMVRIDFATTTTTTAAVSSTTVATVATTTTTTAPLATTTSLETTTTTAPSVALDEEDAGADGGAAPLVAALALAAAAGGTGAYWWNRRRRRLAP